MHSTEKLQPREQILQELLGYLNFSAGAADPQFLKDLNLLYAQIEHGGEQRNDSWKIVQGWLTEALARLRGGSAAFRDVQQAEGALSVTFEHFIPAYRARHRDLLVHQPDADLWRPFMLGRAFEAVLHQGGPWSETERIVRDALTQLNDYVGHRPVAVLRTAQRIEPYPLEWIRPIPLYVRGSGTGVGRYQELLDRTLAILAGTDELLLAEAHFNPQLLDELAIDPRAYDFDHPVNKRPNYHFGQWDPHHIDSQGRYRRFVVQQVTLDALLDRVLKPDGLPPHEVLLEAAAVLAGIMLMAAGTSGSGPGAHDSTLSLGTLLPRIAAYRDAFYVRLLETVPAGHRERLRVESVSGRQPFSAARQHLNHYLSRRRAAQLEHVHLALLFARMGYADAAVRQSEVIPVASARLRCEIQCRLSTGHLAIEQRQLDRTADLLSESEDLLERAIECGAMVDPWNILGFQGQFSLFPAPENSVPDQRVDQLIEIAQEIIGLYARLLSEAAARGQSELEAQLLPRMSRFASWWDQFAATTVDSIEGFSGVEAYNSARHVADAMRAWHQGGAAAGDIAFWRKHVGEFDSAKSYALVVSALIDQQDFVAARALLMQWLSQADSLALEQGEHSFHGLAHRWLNQLLADEAAGAGAKAAAQAGQDRASLVAKFFDYLEANADEFWEVPRLQLEADDFDGSSADDDDDDPDDEDEQGKDLYGAAYDEMVYVDSTDDGFEADMLESGGTPTQYELEAESRRLRHRLAFLRTVAELWKASAMSLASTPGLVSAEMLARWSEQALVNQERLLKLLAAVERQKVPAPSATRDSLMEYEHRRSVRESLIENIISTAVITADAARFVQAVSPGQLSADATAAGEVLRAVLQSDGQAVRKAWPALLADIRSQPLLYVPINKGGSPRPIIAARSLQKMLHDLLLWLPRLGLLREACQLIETARLMENEHPAGPGAVTEFDHLFESGYKALVESIVEASADWTSADPQSSVDALLVESLELATESLLKQWLAHSRTLRLSVLERIGDERAWKEVVQFVEAYGHDLFTQRFLNLGNLRAIVHQGIDAWLDKLQEDPEQAGDSPLLDELGGKLPRAKAVKNLGLVIEAVVENYTEYRDYNSSTTQSDRGEHLYMLLDFLRLRIQYDRIAWHLRPVVVAHEILVRQRRGEAAELWRRGMAERTGEVAAALEARFAELRKKYAMRLPTIADRLAERFIRPLAIDRVRALVGPAMDAVRLHQPQLPFDLLKQEIDALTQEPTGSGLDVPAWLAALEEEVEQARRRGEGASVKAIERLPPAQVPLSEAEIELQLTDWESERPSG